MKSIKELKIIEDKILKQNELELIGYESVLPYVWVDKEPPKEETNMLCAYCNKKRTGTMLRRFEYSMGSERTGVYGEEFGIAIYCEHCGKLLYQKDLS